MIMPNPFACLNPANPMRNYDMGQLQGMYQSIMGAPNPMAAFSQIAMRNPRMQPIVQALQSGANPQQLYIQMCQQRGIDPQQFLRGITGNNGR